MGVPRRTQTEQHADGAGKQAIAFAEDFDGRLYRPMQQKLGTPIEQIQFAWIEFRRELILPNSLDRIPQLALDVAEQVVKFCVMLRFSWLSRHQRLDMGAGTLIVGRSHIGKRQLITVFVGARIELGSPLEIRERFSRFSFLNQQLSELMIHIEVRGLAGNRFLQNSLLLVEG